ncbi:MAG TPA: sensor histidine kinase [Daejeonella sp.]|nr:sensor histidine kinase [Daejeonella sp.]
MSKTRRIGTHALVWAVTVFLFMLLTGSGKVTYPNIVYSVYFGLINIIVFYINYLIILPQFLKDKKYWQCAVNMLILVILVGLVKYGLARICFDTLILIRGVEKYRLTFWRYYAGAAFVSFFFLFLSTGLKFMSGWFENEKAKRTLEREKLRAELAFLKTQINPHFLFNTLNNIYSLAYQHSAKTPEAILKLSEIMRYMLYESNEHLIDLSKEIRNLENYIALQKLRFKDEAYVQLNISGNSENQAIMPLMLISFVENAFKHGVATDALHPITITIRIEPGELYFSVVNKISNQNKDETGGIGLLNVKRRLDLVYRDKYCLDVEKSGDMYVCHLTLQTGRLESAGKTMNGKNLDI